MSKQDRINQIAQLLFENRYDFRQQGGKLISSRYLTRGQIARALGISLSPHLINLLTQMVDSGDLYCVRGADRMGTHYYAASDELCVLMLEVSQPLDGEIGEKGPDDTGVNGVQS